MVARAAAAVRRRPRREREEEVLVWPDLVFIEFISAVLFTLTLTILSIVINAPLQDRANPAQQDYRLRPNRRRWSSLHGR